LVERHALALAGIQGFLRGEKASFLIIARYGLAGQEHDGQVDAMLAQHAASRNLLRWVRAWASFFPHTQLLVSPRSRGNHRRQISQYHPSSSPLNPKAGWTAPADRRRTDQAENAPIHGSTNKIIKVSEPDELATVCEHSRHPHLVDSSAPAQSISIACLSRS
jgi:hypothetical protein